MKSGEKSSAPTLNHNGGSLAFLAGGLSKEFPQTTSIMSNNGGALESPEVELCSVCKLLESSSDENVNDNASSSSSIHDSSTTTIDDNHDRLCALEDGHDDDETDTEEIVVSANQFNRLDPNRRSFSTPQLVASLRLRHHSKHKGSSSETTTIGHKQIVASSLSQTTGNNNITSTSTAFSQQQQVIKCKSINVKRHQLLGPNGKLRRRTALGLISFGSSHFRLGSINTPPSDLQRQPDATVTEQQQQQQATVREEQTVCGTPTNGWRFWFTGRGTNSGRRSSLLRNLSQFTSSSSASLSTSNRRESAPNELQQQQQQETRDSGESHLEEQRLGHKLDQHQAIATTTTATTTTNQIVPPSDIDGDNTTDPKTTTTQTKTLLSADDNQLICTRIEKVASKQQSRQNEAANKIDLQNVNKLIEQDNHQRVNTNIITIKMPTKIQDNRLINSTGDQQQSLVDKLIDSQIEWRHLIREANGGEQSLKSLSEMQIKRQEVIHELVQTERHHCLTLALMRQVYLSGLRQLNEARTRQDHQQLANNQQRTNQGSRSSLLLSSQQVNDSSNSTSEPIDLDRLFPALEELVQAHELFFAHLRLKLVESCQIKTTNDGRKELIGIVGSLGDLLRDQFRLKKPSEQQQQTETLSHLKTNNNSTSSSIVAISKNNSSSNNNNNNNKSSQLTTTSSSTGNGHKLLQAYAKFCGSNIDSSKYYKHLMRTDKEFKQFIENCNKQHAACRQRGIPECNLLVTQRLTKYPLLIEQLIKSSKDEPEEEAKLRSALAECKSLLDELNQHLARKESFERLLDIYAQFCPKSYTLYNGHLRFTKHDLLQHKRLRQLLHSDDQVRIWSATRRKLFQVLCLILNDIIVFIRVEAPNNNNNLGNGTLDLGSQLQQQSSHLWNTLEPADLIASNSLSHTHRHQQDHHNQHHHHHSLISGLGSQCALINVVANALHSATAQHLMHHSSNHSTNGTQSNQLHQQPNSHHNHHQQQQQQQQQHSSNSQSNQQQGINIRYFFANIDNKSSVISLSKLLIRDKAVNEAEPRTYLISSSPRQPEMYELAFVSRRHQASFVDKLKTCIDQHNKKLEAAAAEAAIHFASGEDHINDLHLSLDSADEDIVINGNHSEDDCSQCDEDEDDDIDQNSSSIGCTCDEQLNNKPEEAVEDSFLSAKQSSPATSEPQAQLLSTDSQLKAKRQRSRQRTRTMGELEFDIEQDLIEPPPVSDHESTADKVNISLDSTLTSNSNYGTPKGCNLDSSEPTICNINDTSSDAIGSDSTKQDTSDTIKNSSNESDQGHSLSSAEQETTNGYGGLNGDEDDEDDLNDDDDDDDECHLASNESGLSERAKDSMDESSPSANPNRQRLRGARRRRAQRPRNVSNQSSSSSEAAHRQAIEMIATAAANNKAVNVSTGNRRDEEDEEFDSGRGQDDSSSTSSQSVAKKSISLTVVDKSPAQTTSGQEKSSSTSGSSASSTASGARSSPSGKTPTTTTIETTATSDCPMMVRCCSSTAHSSSFCCHHDKSSPKHVKQQRKLSTVSSMSSQLKLLSRLRNSSTPQSASGRSCNPVNDELSPTSTSCCCQCRSQTAAAAAACSGSGSGSPIHKAATLNRQMRQQMRRSAFVPEQKLEELRNLQLQLERDKKEWLSKFERMQEELLNERHALDVAREKLRQDRHQVANEREQLYRKLDVLKEKGILLSPSHKVIITAPELRQFEQKQLHQYNPNNHQSVNRPQTNGGQFVSTSCVQIVQQQTNQRNSPMYNSNNGIMASVKVPLHLSENVMHHQHRQSMVINGSQQFGAKLPFISSLLGSDKTSKIVSNTGTHLI